MYWAIIGIVTVALFVRFLLVKYMGFKVDDATHLTAFVSGALILAVLWEFLTWKIIYTVLPIALMLAGSYFWIRLDLWRDNKTIREICVFRDEVNATVKNDLISRRIDSRAAFLLLAVATLVQAFFSAPKLDECITYFFVCFAVACLIIPITNFVVRKIEKPQLNEQL